MYIRFRRSYSTPSETLPATSRRATLKASRNTPAAISTDTSGHRSVLPWRIRSIVSPTMNGMSTPAPIATAASRNETLTPRR